MTKFFLTCAFAALAAVIGATELRASVNFSGTDYIESFDSTLAGTSVTGAFSATAGTQAAIPGSSGWDGVKLSGTGTNAMNFTVDNGNGNAGAIYNYGATGGPDRALGVVASGTNIAGFGVSIVNTNATALTDLWIMYQGEFWRSSTSTQNTLTFAYEIGPAGSTTYLSDAGAIGVASLNLVGPPAVATNGPLDGTLAGNETSFLGHLTGIDVEPGQSLYVRWQDANDVGNDAGLAVDDFHLSTNQLFLPVPGDLNGDHAVDAADYTIFKSEFLQTASGLVADLNHDGKVDLFDFVIFKADYALANGPAVGGGLAAPVPEPASIALVAAALPACWLLRRRRVAPVTARA